MNQFIETKHMFENAIGVKYPLSYEGWLAVKDDLKAAALYVQFFDQITLAWNKGKSDFTSDEDGVSIVLQYLNKNVPIILNNPKKYTSKYIYRVAYNCMGCLRRVQREINYYNLTISNIDTDSTGKEFDLFSTIVDDKSDTFETVEKIKYNTEIYNIIKKFDKATKRFVEYLLGGREPGKRIEAKRDTIISNLRTMLIDYKDIYCDDCTDDILRFGSVLKIDDNVSSAVVVMVDGINAVYYGEQVADSDGNINVIFFGPNTDYIVPIQIAKNLKVLNVELY